MEAVAVTDRGLVRARNEDSYYIDDERALFVLCDGMGGHKAGNVASQMAVEEISKEYQVTDYTQVRKALQKAVHKANNAIWQAGNRNIDYRDMGTTAVIAVISMVDETLKLSVANVGDSRLYVVRDDSIRQVTVDHTVSEQMRMQGIITLEESLHSPFSHVLTRALGTHSEIEADIFEEDLFKDDLIIMCSDGLSDMLNNQEILEISRQEKDVDRLSQMYLRSALEKGGHDNVTFILINV